jgi:hypothetical protein
MANVLWKDMATLSTTIHVMAVVIVLLMYCAYKTSEDVKVLQQEHSVLLRTEGFTYNKPIGGHARSDTGGESKPFGSVGSDGFLGAYGPPVFYDIGDANAQRKYQTGQSGKASTSNEYKIDYTKKYASGRPMFKAKTNDSGHVTYFSLPDNDSEGMDSDESLLARAQGFRSH